MNKRITKKKGELEEEVECIKTFRLMFERDEIGRYVPVCTFAYHRGIDLSEDVCIGKRCKYYKRAYIDETRKYRHFEVYGARAELKIKLGGKRKKRCSRKRINELLDEETIQEHGD